MLRATSYERRSVEESSGTDSEDEDEEEEEEERAHKRRRQHEPPEPRSPARSRPLFDLTTPHSRTTFIAVSIKHLFSTTYSRTDSLTVSALLSYLNCAYPEGKWNEFDFSEVVRGIGRVKEVQLLGDNVTWKEG